MYEWPDAVTAPPWPQHEEQAAHTHTYAADDLLIVRLRVDGQVRTGAVQAHVDCRRGRAVQLLFAPALNSGEYKRWVWWDPSRMQLIVRTGHSPAEATPGPHDAIQVALPYGLGELLEETAYRAPRWPRRWVRVGAACTRPS